MKNLKIWFLMGLSLSTAPAFALEGDVNVRFEGSGVSSGDEVSIYKVVDLWITASADRVASCTLGSNLDCVMSDVKLPGLKDPSVDYELIVSTPPGREDLPSQRIYRCNTQFGMTGIGGFSARGIRLNEKNATIRSGFLWTPGSVSLRIVDCVPQR